MSNIVERLRNVGRDYDFHENALIYEAADEIERLRAENERLRDKLTFETEFGVNTFEKMNVNRIEIERLQARETRLREAMEKIVRVPLWDEYKCVEIARAALGEEKK